LQSGRLAPAAFNAERLEVGIRLEAGGKPPFLTASVQGFRHLQEFKVPCPDELSKFAQKATAHAFLLFTNFSATPFMQ
jgi:hypothetical protein